jgi:hypothetical protein
VEPPSAGTLSAADLRDILAEAIHDVRSKKMPPRTAGALAQLCNSVHRILPTADLEARLARLEQQLAERESLTSVNTDPARSPRREEGRGGTNAQPDVDTPGRGDNDGSGKDRKQ